MRSLNKIVFINSAHVRYAEIGLNGNVHLIGTQGVGKSTLLRAILFFYNADKQKLGIPKEKKSFDDFYFEQSNSYVVYEVERDESAFCVLVSKSNGRAVFRFIDSPYKKEWLIDDNGEVTAEMATVRTRLNGCYMSPIVDRYEMFRDIIYGNHQAVMRKEFFKFSIAESSRYQNIPRSIQNVFLNSKLDADFIKETIIQSMDSESSFIDLGYFRHQVSEFEQEYNDIGLWFTTNKRGECETRLDADRVVKIYHSLLGLKKNIEDCGKQLNYSYRVAKEQLPSIVIEIEKSNEALNDTIRLISEESEKFNKERDGLNADLTLVRDNLKKCRDKFQEYQAKNIDEILKKQEREGSLKIEKERLEERRRLLTREYEDVAEKFENLLKQVSRALEEFKQNQNIRLNDKNAELLEQRQRVLAKYEQMREAIVARCDEKLVSVKNTINALNADRVACEKELLRLQYEHPFKDKINECDEQLKSLNIHESETKVQKSVCQAELNKLSAQRDAELERNRVEYEKENDALVAENRGFVAQLKSLDDLLERQKGSLYEWLSQNKPGWENSIGKVVDEESVLYNTELSPELVEGDALFGVIINLEDLPIRVRTPEEIAVEKKAILKSVEDNKSKQTELSDALEKKNSVVERSYAPKIKPLLENIRNAENELVQIPIKRKRLENEREKWIRNDAAEIEKRKNEIQSQQSVISEKLLNAEEQQNKIVADKNRELKANEKAKQQENESLQNAFNDFRVQIHAEIETRKNEAENERKLLLQQRDEELKNKNVDVSVLKECEAEIDNVQQQLNEIEQNRDLVARYRYDKQEFFDHEDEFKNKKRDIESRLSDLQQRFNARKERLEAKRAEQNKILQQNRETERKLKESVEETDKFFVSSFCPENVKSVGETPNALLCTEILTELKESLMNAQKRSKELEMSINKFKGRFSRRNTFKFKMELNSESDFMDFADNLSDFMLNEKIEEYRKRTSGRYSDILARVAKEVGDVTRQKSEIEKIVLNINRDFVEKNFAGVIKSIALRTEESNDKLMRLMLAMQRFYAENQYALGELNLFSMGDTESANRGAVDLLLQFVKSLNDEPTRNTLKLSDAFRLQFRVQENDNDTGWIDKISNVGSEGTDVLVKAMVNIMLINVFKTQASRKFGEFKLHCMMDEIGKLHPKNANGILKFANSRNIYLVNGSPTTQSVSEYRYTYLLEKNAKSQTVVRLLMTRTQGM